MLGRYSFLDKPTPVKTIATNISVFDQCIGEIPMGRIVEIAGASDVGKTKLLFDIIENANSNTVIAYIATSGTSINYLKYRQLDRKENLIVCLTNEEDNIFDFITSTLPYVDIYMIDSMSNILTNNENDSFSMQEYQDMPSILRKLNTIFHGERASLLAINTLTYKDDKWVSRWRNVFQKYCTIRVRLNEYSSTKEDLELVTHKLSPELVGRSRHE